MTQEQYIQSLINAKSDDERTLIVTEYALADFPEPIRTVARQCGLLRRFDTAVVAQLLIEQGTDGEDAADVLAQIIALSFVEPLDVEETVFKFHTATAAVWKPHLEENEPELVQAGWRAAARAYLQKWDDDNTAILAVQMLVNSRQIQEVGKRFSNLSERFQETERWELMLQLYETINFHTISFPEKNTISSFLLWWRYGFAHHQLGNLDRAIEAYTQAIRLNPQYAHAFYNRGIAHTDEGYLQQALADYEEAIRLDPQYVHVLGDWESVDEDEVDADYSISNNDPKEYITYSNQGVFYGQKGRLNHALSAFDEAIRLNPQFADAFYYRGVAYGQKGEIDRSLSDLDEAIRLNPQYANAYHIRGILYAMELKQYQRAIDDFTRAYELNSSDFPALVSLGLMFKLSGDPEQAKSILNRAQPMVSEQSIYNRACYAAIREDIELALRLLRQALVNRNLPPEWVWKDIDLILIRDDERFQALLARFEHEIGTPAR